MIAMAERPLIFIAYLTGDTDTPNSRRVGCVATISSQIKTYVANAIIDRKATYQNERMSKDASCYMQRYNFLHDWDAIPGVMRRKVMNERLKGVFLDTAIGGKEYVPADLRNA